MSIGTQVDYTTRRLGERVSRNERIAVCPKCGRRGAYRSPGRYSTGEVRPALYTHRAHDWGGLHFIDDCCQVAPEEATA